MINNITVNIAIVCQHYHPEPFTITSIAEELVKRGHHVVVLTSKPTYGYDQIPSEYINKDYEVLNGVEVYRVDSKIRKDSKFSIIENYLSFWKNAKKKALKIGNFDVIYSMSLSPIIMVSPALKIRKKQNIPLLLHCLDLWPESVLITNAIKRSNPLYCLLKIWSKYIYSRCDKILVSSPSFIDYFSSYLHIKNVPLEYLPQPAFLAKEKEESVIYDEPTFLYCGNIGKLQMVDKIIKAFSKIEGKAKLVIIGMGSEKENVINYIKSNNLEERIIYLGPKRRDEANAYYKNATALIVSLKEGGTVGKTIPNKLVTSLYYARPILGIIKGDGRKILEESNGSFLANEDEESIINAFNSILSLDKEKLDEMGRNNKKYYDSHFDFNSIVDSIESNLMTLKKK